MRVLYLAGNRKLIEILGSILRIVNLKACCHSDTLPPTQPYPLQQSHISFMHIFPIYFLPPNSATPYEIMGVNYTQTTTYTNLSLALELVLIQQYLLLCSYIQHLRFLVFEFYFCMGAAHRWILLFIHSVPFNRYRLYLKILILIWLNLNMPFCGLFYIDILYKHYHLCIYLTYTLYPK